jgi:hypothetical protein
MVRFHSRENGLTDRMDICTVLAGSPKMPVTKSKMNSQSNINDETHELWGMLGARSMLE